MNVPIDWLLEGEPFIEHLVVDKLKLFLPIVIRQ